MMTDLNGSDSATSSFRFLHEEETDDFENYEGPSCETFEINRDGQDLRNTLRLYGTIFVCILLAFCWLRRKFPNVYNVRNRVEDLKTPLASEHRGLFAWMWRVFGITDSEMLDECGMDALCFTRVLEFGIKLSCVGMLNAMWLIPVYATAEPADNTDCISDKTLLISVSHLPQGSYRYCATAVGTYIVTFFTMYQILEEFSWFIRFRHRFLSKKMARNYSVYVQNIPSEYQSNKMLRAFFEQSSAKGAVFDAHVAIKAPNLKSMVAKREALVGKLEHAINIEEITGVTPMARAIGVMGKEYSVIEEGFKELQELNKKVSETIDRLDRQAHGMPPLPDVEEDIPTLMVTASDSYGEEVSKVSLLTTDKLDDETLQGTERSWKQPEGTASDEKGLNPAKALFSVASKASAVAGNVGGVAGNVAFGVMNLLKTEDGEPYSAGFVTFKSLRSAQAALQMIQFGKPFAMEVLEAPEPEDIYWENIGKSHKELQLGLLLSMGLTTALCLFWTIPMGFIASISDLEGLSENVKFVRNLLDDFPWLAPVFAQLAPLLIIVANEILLIILEKLSGLEGPISGAVVQAKLFSKMAAFMIIQTFFVTAIGGSLTKEIKRIGDDPLSLFYILGSSLPSQSTFYIQILLVDTSISLGVELLRVSAVAVAIVRSFVGPKLTEKERTTTWMGLRPLTDPPEFEHASLMSGTVLYFMVFFVYSSLAPITTIFMFVCFVIISAGYRHQFVYIYPTKPDSGGHILSAFIRFVPIMMLISQMTIIGTLAINRATIASAMMTPLFVTTLLFTMYIGQKHFEMTKFLPSKDAIAIDILNNSEGPMDTEFIEDMYVQPELRERELFPENTTVELEIHHGCVSFETPPGSEVDPEDR